MKRKDIKVKVLLAIEQVKAKYELIFDKFNEVDVDIEVSKQDFLNSSFNQFSQLKEKYLNIPLTIADDCKSIEETMNSQTLEDPIFTDKKPPIIDSLTQIKTNYDTIKKNVEVINNFSTDLSKEYELSNTNLNQLQDDIKKLKEREVTIKEKLAKMISEITEGLLTTEYESKKIQQLNADSKTIDSKRTDFEKEVSKIKERLTIWKKQIDIFPTKNQQIENHDKVITKALAKLKEETKKVTNYVDTLNKQAIEIKMASLSQEIVEVPIQQPEELEEQKEIVPEEVIQEPIEIVKEEQKEILNEKNTEVKKSDKTKPKLKTVKEQSKVKPVPVKEERLTSIVAKIKPVKQEVKESKAKLNKK